MRREVASIYPIDASDPEKVEGLADIALSGSAADLDTGTIPAGRMPAHTGDVTSSAGAVALTIPNDTVTYPKMQNASAASRLLGRGSASGAGDIEEITLGSGLSMTGTSLAATFTDPWTYDKLTTTFATTSTSAVTCGLSIAGSSFLANSFYEFEALVRLYYDSGNFPTVSFVWPTGLTAGGVLIIGPDDTITKGVYNATVDHAPLPGHGTYWPLWIRGFLYTGGSAGGGTLDIQIKGFSGGAAQVAVSAGSFIKYRSYT